jgi:hypothetical protein
LSYLVSLRLTLMQANNIIDNQFLPSGWPPGPVNAG